MINYLTPSNDIHEVTEDVRQTLKQQGVLDNDLVDHVIKHAFFNNAKLMADRGVDFWLYLGGYLPAVEWVIAKQNNESEDAFYERTQYPKSVIEAYSVEADDLATLVAADAFKNYHLGQIVANTSRWSLNEDEELFIDLSQFENRLKGFHS
ncbi:hypothetical protein [Acinetobacter boissieri]|uniref:Uncharacterized protein n=1 Tax=Acinetobacter boissieri TaxID=1219383 RepID=A0A1G6GYA7_9GAMM|nr:hypothetical protein [Acinetobacter boissieri]SDB87040.1 hypothetical protein SAMN05421733_10332 [Acinetobacter boissieri]